MTQAGHTVVIAVGGNALIRDGQQGTIDEQRENARATAVHVGALAARGWRIVLTHGNGPQVGFILRRSEMVAQSEFTPRLSLDMCVADSEGGIGYILGNALVSELGRRGMADRVACLLTQTVVDRDDPAFQHPSKPIGGGYSPEEAELHRRRHRWVLVEDAGRGDRRLVPSPRPVRIEETGAIAALLEAGFVVIACGGGGIPVVEEAPTYTRAWRPWWTRTSRRVLWPRACALPTSWSPRAWKRSPSTSARLRRASWIASPCPRREAT